MSSTNVQLLDNQNSLQDLAMWVVVEVDSLHDLPEVQLRVLGFLGSLSVPSCGMIAVVLLPSKDLPVLS